MLIAEVSQRRVIATALAVCYIFVCYFEGLSKKVYATMQSIGKQAIKLSELAPWDVETFLNDIVDKINSFAWNLNKNIQVLSIYPKDEDKEVRDQRFLVMNIYNLNNVIAKPLTISL